MELKPIVKEWLAALRSGVLVQTKERLGRIDGSRCCLGVACDIAVKRGIIPPPVPNDNPVVPSDALTYGASKDDGSLPEEVMLALGMKSRIGSYLNEAQKKEKESLGYQHSVSNCLAQDNDSHGKTFSEIADIIESRPEALFQRAGGTSAS